MSVCAEEEEEGGREGVKTGWGGRADRTMAVLGNTKENQVIWKGILERCSGKMYFQREPTEEGVVGGIYMRKDPVVFVNDVVHFTLCLDEFLGYPFLAPS